MTDRPHGAPNLRAPTFADLTASLCAGLGDFAAAPHLGLFFAGFYVVVGVIMAAITYTTGTTFWLILAVLGFPLIGAFAALGLYEVSRRRQAGHALPFSEVVSVVWAEKNGQLPWLAVMVVVLFLFWFFLGHMIFALFLGLSPMTNVSTSLDIFLTADGLTMLAFGTAVGAAFATLTFAMSVLGMPMLLDRDVDFMTALTRSIGAVADAPVIYLSWGAFIAAITIAAMIPGFLGLFLVMPVLGHATWHLYKRVSLPPAR
ncbi:DUF2189 domain-containing protein [uncultured Tateyamaria sp.]|uniref:DUF2189 domain-containing protein n=1 Tax=Tateyamaria sp. 1078 TaxID=3417464 RepID=UPI0026319F24|nr:DUF2189 domain-containing protein [uncultured Tateyamaria sp.]